MPQSNLRYIDLTFSTATSDGEPVPGTERRVVILFNKNRISKEEVEELVNKDMFEYDDRVVVLRPGQLDWLRDKEDVDDKKTG